MFVLPKLMSILSGIILALPFYLLWLFSKGKLMGFGDIKLILGLGWLFGLSSGICLLFVSFWLGAIIGILLMTFSKKKFKMKTQVPFAPFLVMASIIVFIFSLNFYSIMYLFNV